eukprot:CAMPEP_0184348556 /NCGR_PEP_ID=MMETSP1089-20130417/27736_1 /TAXON_ID=38269 ORGANISM="Gloeochaete wittrockiana, Strain SAG46.84" /NCGR_SAMPLE_ID=MMETSP1089 /ASSEMBLY_ACC=CAM_ASM_000445 /LENGTH=320 /DNA_ID=CAMNT_0026680313 /DNA_START=152 /DNA_END=1111 /DNA_ORIENTATION=+
MDSLRPKRGLKGVPSPREPWEIDACNIQLSEKPIGKGGYGEVYRARWAGQYVAAKRLLLSRFEDPELIREFRSEASIMSTLRHPNIISFYGACFEPENYFIITEFAERGNLFEHLRAGRMEIGRKLEILRDIACGMLYLVSHQRPSILHRDLKSPNVLLTRDGTAKLCDFGYARVKTETMHRTKMVGTPQWMANELLSGSGQPSEKSDVFSFGVIMWEVATQLYPWENMPAQEVIRRVVRGERLRVPSDPTAVDAWFQWLIPKCWHSNPRLRPTFKELYNIIQARLDESHYSSAPPLYQSVSNPPRRSGSPLADGGGGGG